MILMKDIIREGNPILRASSDTITMPASDEDKKTLIDMVGYLFNSQDDEKAKKLGLRPGVGLAAPQIGINKQMFAIFASDMDGKAWLLPVVNPTILKKSKEMVYLPGGEGCLSVDRETTGVTPRYQKILVEADIYNIKTNKFDHKKFELKDYIAIVFQHEYDHLFGTLYVDKLFDPEDAKKRGITPLWEIDEEE